MKVPTVVQALRHDRQLAKLYGARAGKFYVLVIGETPTPDGSKTNLPWSFAFRAIQVPSPRWVVASMPSHLVQLLTYTRHANLLDVQPDRQGRGSKFPVAKAVAAAVRTKQEIGLGPFPYRVVLLAGRRVASAFKVPKTHYYERVGEGFPVRTYVVPHPVGSRSWWNYAANCREALAFLDGLAQEVSAWRSEGS